MFTPIIQFWRRKSKWQILAILFLLSLLSAYPIYKNFYNGRAVTTYERHMALIEGRSEYYNPWQYRMLCPIIIEGLKWVYDHSIDKIYPIEEKFNFKIEATSEPTPETKEFLELMQTKGAIKYMIIFVFFRFVLNLTVFILAWSFWRYFLKNNYLILLGLSFLSLAMGNAVMASDLTFNTYLDNVFYLLTANIIVYRKNPYWLIPITVLAAFNRETGLLIPVLYFFCSSDISKFRVLRLNLKAIRFPKVSVFVLTALLYVLFFSIFIGLRLYYGYQEPQQWKVPAGLQMVKLNLLSSVAVKAYFEMLGVFALIPFVVIYKLRSFPQELKNFFWAIVPIWFAVHIYTVVIYQTRLFMVPLILALLPMMMWLIENQGKKRQSEVERAL